MRIKTTTTTEFGVEKILFFRIYLPNSQPLRQTFWRDSHTCTKSYSAQSKNVKLVSDARQLWTEGWVFVHVPAQTGGNFTPV